MPRPKTIEDSVRVSVVMSNKQLDRIQHLARQMSVRGKRTVTTSEAIRMAVEAVYPLPKDQQLTFGRTR